MIEFVPRMIPDQIYVIGCGGTGSRLVPLLTQFMRTVTQGVTPRGNVVNPTIYLIDNDSVEHKNLLRQHFIESDVGKPKAAVLANRYSRAYGVNVIPVIEMVKPDERLFRTLDAPPENPGSNCLVIMCVDSAQARRDIIETWGKRYMSRISSSADQQAFFVDAGNEDNFGQVRFFHRAVGYISTPDTWRDVPKMTPAKVQTEILPMDIGYYMNLQDNPGDSCAELDQTLAINALMATLIMGVVQNFYYMKPFNYHCLSISLNGAVSSSPLTPAYLKSIARVADRSIPVRYLPIAGDTLESFEQTRFINQYIDENVDALEAMGLKPDGTALEKLVPLGGTIEFKVGDVVRIERAVYSRAQRGYTPRDLGYTAGWYAHLDGRIGCTGKVTASTVNGVTIDYGYSYSPYSLVLVSRPEPGEEPTPEVETPRVAFMVGETVRIVQAVYSPEQERGQSTDPDYGATWEDEMDDTIGELGVVDMVHTNGDVVVRVNGDFWSYSPRSLRREGNGAQATPHYAPVNRYGPPPGAMLPDGVTAAPPLVPTRRQA